MSPRRYTLRKRAEVADATRRRILEAIVSLHAELGVSATSAADIAARADVAIGTVHRYFPSIDLMVEACGAHLRTISPLPDECIFEDLTDFASRMRALIASWFTFYEGRAPWLRKAAADAGRVKALGESLARTNAHREATVRRALEPANLPVNVARVAIALTSAPYWQSLVDSGLASSDAASLTTDVLLAWIRSGTPLTASEVPRWKPGSPKSPTASTDSRPTSRRRAPAGSRSTSS